MAAPINLPVNAPANIDTPSTGRYNLFLNSSDSDQLYKKDSSGVSTAVVIAGSGTVTSISIASANGLAGTSDGNAATPTITLSTSITGLLKGNGTAISAAVAGTDYLTPTGSGSGLSGVVTTVNGASGAITNIGVTTNPLSQFAATTSLQLAGVISDETGSGALVFGTSPTLVTPSITTSITAGGSGGITIKSSGGLDCFLFGASGANNTAYSNLKLDYGTASTVVYLDASKNLISLANAAGVLTNNGSGTLSWATASSGITVGTTTITSGTSRRIGYNLAGVYQEAANELYFESASPYAHVYAGGRTGVITGLNNSFFGREAGKLVTTGDRNTFFGAGAGAGSPSSTSSSTLVGFLAGGNNPGGGLVAIGVTTGGITSTGSGVAIGNDANVGNGSGNTIVGPSATTIGSGAAVAIGANAVTTGAFGPIALGAYSTATQSGAMALGYGADATHVYSIAFGYNAATTAANQLMVGNSDASFGGSSGITDICFGNGDAATSAASPTIRATSGSGTNNAGASITHAAGKATGTGAGGDIKHQTSVKGSSGTTLQTSGDRFTIIGKYVDLTAATATAFCRINIPTSTTAGGFVIATVEANDGTDFQARTFYISWAAANKAGTTTVGLDVPHEIVAATSGTLTGTMTLVDSGSGNIDFKMDASSSLAETTLRISFQVFKNFGTGAVSAS